MSNFLKYISNHFFLYNPLSLGLWVMMMIGTQGWNKEEGGEGVGEGEREGRGRRGGEVREGEREGDMVAISLVELLGKDANF